MESTLDKPRLFINSTLRLSVDDYLRVKKQAKKLHLTYADFIRIKIGLPPNRRKRPTD